VSHDDPSLLRLDVDVTRTGAHAVGEELVDESRHRFRIIVDRRGRRAGLRIGGEMLDVR
jgi:hypothetical protein